jgi:hypothetical protein
MFRIHSSIRTIVRKSSFRHVVNKPTAVQRGLHSKAHSTARSNAGPLGMVATIGLGGFISYQAIGLGKEVHADVAQGLLTIVEERPSLSLQHFQVCSEIEEGLRL